jgi:hypothetical protein
MQEGSPSIEHPSSWPNSIASSPAPDEVNDLEVSSRQELIRDGAHPVCPIEELSDVLGAPVDKFKLVQTWLTDFPDSRTGAGELKTVFSRQFRRWWQFRKSQWDSRGMADSATGFSAFLEACRRRYECSSGRAIVSEPSFNETIHRQWQGMQASLQEPIEGQTFAQYHNTFKIRLAPYCFTPSLQLRKDPQKQNAWTDWLEYLSFEVAYLERLNAVAESLEPDYLQSVRKVQSADEADRNSAAITSATSDSTHVRYRAVGEQRGNIPKGSAAGQPDYDASQKSIWNFVRETKACSRARRQALYQRHRVDWVVREARLMETDVFAQKNLGKGKKRKFSNQEFLEPRRKKKNKQWDGC